MRHSITILIWTLSIFTSWGDVAIIRTTPAAIQSLVAKPDPPTENENNPFLLLAGPKPPVTANPIKDLIPGVAHDLKQWLKGNGVEMGTKDLALCFWDNDLVVVRSSSAIINSVRMLVETQDTIRPDLEVTLRVREGMDAASKDLCRLETLTRSGYKLPVSDVDFEADIELTLSSDEDVVETRIGFIGRADLAGKSVNVSLVAKPGEDVRVASWTAHEKSVFLSLKVQPIQRDKQGGTAAQLLELTQKVTKALRE